MGANMPDFQIHGKGDRDEMVTLNLPDVSTAIAVVESLWTDEIFRNEGGSPFTLAKISLDGKIVADGWLERAGWMWDDIVTVDEDSLAYEG
jgi:hypothetical protein